MLFVLFPLAAFFIASIPFGLLLGKVLKGIDIRDHGSGNIGATNVFRVLGKGPGIGCLVLDALKGYLPVLLAINILALEGRPIVPELSFLASMRQTFSIDQQLLIQTIHVLTALAAILGHNYSPWLGFKGGKGVATSAGVLLALMPFAVIILILIFVLITAVSRYVSLGSILTSAALPFLTLWGSWHHGRIQDGTWNKPLFVFAVVIAVLVVWKHRSNIARLRAGTENKFGAKKKSLEANDTPSSLRK